MLRSSLFLSVGLRNRQLLQVTFCRCAHCGAGKLSEILTVELGKPLPCASPSAAAVLLSIIIVGMNPDIQHDLTLLRELDHVHISGLYRRVPHDRH
jgi:hypothetical protein